MPIESNEEDVPLFEEEEQHDKSPTNLKEEGPSEPIQPIIIPEMKKMPTWLKATLEDAEGHGVEKITFRESKRPKIYSRYVAYMTKLIEAEPNTFEESTHQE